MQLSPKQADLLAIICKLQCQNKEDVTVEKIQLELGINKDYVIRIISGLPERNKILKKIKVDRKTIYSLNPDEIVTSSTVASILLELKKATPSDYIKQDIFEQNILSMDFMKHRDNNNGESDAGYLARVLEWCKSPDVLYIRSFPSEVGFIGINDRVREEQGYLERVANIKEIKKGK